MTPVTLTENIANGTLFKELAMAAKTPHWIDFDSSPFLAATTMDQASQDLMDLIVKTAGGQLTCNEKNDEREIAIWKNGVTL